MVKYFLLCLLIALGVMAWSEVPVDRGPGITANKTPELILQRDIEDISYSNITLKPLGEISAEVRVLDKKRYFFDGMKNFSKYDVLVGWSQLSDQRNLDYLHFKIKDRSFKYNKARLPLEPAVIDEQTALWHMIASTDEIKRGLASLRNGHIITIKGHIVDVVDVNGFTWQTSKQLVGRDKERPINEIILVTSLTKK